MPILYGTTADGESLPVQVNEFGQLVAQGLAGPPGPEGQPGPPNPDGELPITYTEFTPVFESDHEDGSALFDYEQQFGALIRYGDLLAVSVRLVSRDDVVTNARGNILIGGLPKDFLPLNTFSAGVQGITSVDQVRFRGLTDLKRPSFVFLATNMAFSVREFWNGQNQKVNFSNLDGNAQATNIVNFSWLWFSADALPSG